MRRRVAPEPACDATAGDGIRQLEMQRLAALPPVRQASLTGIGVALIIGGGWIALTATTGKTYHLAALLGALAPSLTVRAVLGARLGVMPGLLLGAIGAGLMLASWAGIVALGIEPAATLADGIPGEVFGEVVIGASAGLLGSALLHRRLAVEPN